MEISGYFILFVFIVTTLVVGFCIWNAVNYFKLKDDNTTNPTLSTTLENTLAILNIVLVVLAFIVWCFCIYYWFSARSFGRDSFDDMYNYRLLDDFADMNKSSRPMRPASPSVDMGYNNGRMNYINRNSPMMKSY
jgi:hypothetical protein